MYVTAELTQQLSTYQFYGPSTYVIAGESDYVVISCPHIACGRDTVVGLPVS